MKAEITFRQLWNNPSVFRFFFRHQSTKTLLALIHNSNLSANEVCERIENYANDNVLFLDDIEEMLYNDSEEELAREFGIELYDEDNEE